MSTTTFEPLPSDLRSLGEDGFREAARVRRERAQELADAVDEGKSLKSNELAEFKSLNSDLKRIGDFVEAEQWPWMTKHPGHPTGERDSRFDGEKLGGSFYEAIVKAGWDPVTKNRVTVPTDAALFKAVTVTGDIEDYYPRSVPSTVLGADRRYLYPALRQVRVSATDTSVQYLNQSARTLAATNDMIRAIDAVTEKPETALTVELASADLKQVAHKVSGVPNIVARQRPFRDLIEGDLRLGLSEALDAMADAAITAATVPMAGAGANIGEKIAYAKGEVEDAGYNPDTVVLSPTEAVELDLLLLETLNSTGTSPLFGLRPRISKARTLSIVFDSSAFASLHAGPVEFASFEENDGATNSQLYRAELNAVCVVNREDAGCEVWGS